MPLSTELRGDQLFDLYVPGVAAATPIEVPGLVAPANLLITGVRWVPNAAVTANASNFATLSFRNRTGAGVGTAVPATRSYAATNSVAQVAEAMTLSGTATDLQVAAGDVLTLGIVHSGTGLTIPPGLIQIAARYR